MSRDTALPTILHVRLLNTDQLVHPHSIIRVFTETMCVVMDPMRFQADSECTDCSTSSQSAHAI